MSCKGLHCDGCGGGGGAAAAVIALLVIIALGLRKAWPEIVHMAEIAAWTVAGVTGGVIVITGGVLTVRVARRVRARRAAREVTYHATVIPRAGRPAIDRPRWPVWVYSPGCCENWTPGHGCPHHTGRPAMSLQARDEWPDRRGSDERRPR